MSLLASMPRGSRPGGGRLPAPGQAGWVIMRSCWCPVIVVLPWAMLRAGRHYDPAYEPGRPPSGDGQVIAPWKGSWQSEAGDGCWRQM